MIHDRFETPSPEQRSQMATTKAQEMARRKNNGEPDWWDEVMDQVQVYLIFDDGSVMFAWDMEPCRFEMHDGKVRAVIFDEIKDSPEPT
jgi:hypothetical protein